MKNSKNLIFLALLGLMACESSQKTEETTSTEIDEVKTEEISNSTTVTIREITVDKYPFTPKEIQANQKITQTVESWFSNSELNETLIFYTQKTNKVYHFNNQNVPNSFPSLVYLHDPTETIGEGYNVFSKEQRQNYISEFAMNGKQANTEKFITQQGIKLGVEKSLLIDLYGQPQSQESTDGVEILKWEFAGDGYGEVDINETVVAKDSFGYEVTAFIENGKLVAQILEDFYP